VIAAFGPASGSVDVRCFPERGALASPGDGARLAAFELPLVRGGHMQDYWVWVALVDGDAADVASAIDGVAGRLRRAILSALGGASGELAEGLVQRRSFKDSVVEAVVAEAGAPDAGTAAGRVRVSPPICLRVHWSALGPRPAAPRPRRESDGHTVIAGWTHRLTVSDGDAGSAGQMGDERCTLFIRAQTRVERREIEVEIPGPGTFRESSRSANE
jgi:hypothetical protein